MGTIWDQIVGAWGFQYVDLTQTRVFEWSLVPRVPFGGGILMLSSFVKNLNSDVKARQGSAE